MTLLALLLALAQQGGQPTTHDQPGVSQPSPNDARPDRSTSSNTTDKAESLPSDHHTDLQGEQPAKKTKRGKGMVSRTWCRPQIHPRVRSTPSPNPEWGTDPNLRRSRYQENASRGSLCSSIARSSVS